MTTEHRPSPTSSPPTASTAPRSTRPCTPRAAPASGPRERRPSTTTTPRPCAPSASTSTRSAVPSRRRSARAPSSDRAASVPPGAGRARRPRRLDEPSTRPGGGGSGSAAATSRSTPAPDVARARPPRGDPRPQQRDPRRAPRPRGAPRRRPRRHPGPLAPQRRCRAPSAHDLEGRLPAPRRPDPPVAPDLVGSAQRPHRRFPAGQRRGPGEQASTGQVVTIRSAGTPSRAARSQPYAFMSSWPGAWASESMAKRQPTSSASRDQRVGRVLALGAAVDLDSRPVLGARLEDGAGVELRLLPRPARPRHEAAGAVAEDVDPGVRDGCDQPRRHRRAVHLEVRVDRRRDEVEAVQHRVALVEGAVLEDVDLDALEQAQVVADRAVDRSTTASWAASRSALSPLATRRRGLWSVRTIHSWPVSTAGEHHLLDRRPTVGPVRVGVAVAAERGIQPLAPLDERTAGGVLQLVARYAGSSPRAAPSTTPAVDFPIPGSSLEGAGLDAVGDLLGGEPTDRGGGLAERLDPVAAGAGPLEEERDPAQRVDGVDGRVEGVEEGDHGASRVRGCR